MDEFLPNAQRADNPMAPLARALLGLDFFKTHPFSRFYEDTRRFSRQKTSAIWWDTSCQFCWLRGRWVGMPFGGLQHFKPVSARTGIGTPDPNVEQTSAHLPANTLSGALVDERNNAMPYVIVLDDPGVFINLEQIDRHDHPDNRSMLSELRSSGHAALNAAELAGRSASDFRWDLLTPHMRPVSPDGSDPTALVSAVPDSLGLLWENWIHARGGLPSAIIPAPLAVAGWVSEKLETGVEMLLSIGWHRVHLIVFQDRECTAVRTIQTPPEDDRWFDIAVSRVIADLGLGRKGNFRGARLHVWNSDPGARDLIGPSVKAAVGAIHRLGNDSLSLPKAFPAAEADPRIGPLTWAVNAIVGGHEG